MDFPDLDEFNEENKMKNNKLLDIMMLSGDKEEFDGNLLSWKLVSISPTLMEVDLEFYKPLEVSQGDIADKIVV